MKIKYFIFLLAFLLLITSVSAEIETIFYDNFNRTTLGSDYTVSASGTGSITVGENHLKLYKTGLNDGSQRVQVNKDLTILRPEYIEFKINFSAYSSGIVTLSQDIVAISNAYGAINTMSGISKEGSTTIKYIPATLALSGSYSNAVSYIVKYKINWTANTFDIYIDDVLKQANISMATNKQYLYLAAYNSNVNTVTRTTYVDYLHYYNITEDATTFRITAKDAYTNTALDVFSANVTYLLGGDFSGSNTVTFTTETGTIDTELSDLGLINVTVFANNYDTVTYTDYDSSANLNAELNPEFFDVDFTASDYWTSNAITDFNVTYRGVVYEAIAGTATVPLDDLTDTFNVTALNYYTGVYVNQLVTSPFDAILKRPRLTVTYSNYSTTGGTDYARTVGYQVVVEECRTGTNYLLRYVNGTAQNTVTYNCVDNQAIVTGTYQHSTAGTYTLKFTTIGTNTLLAETATKSFYQDLSTPVVAGISEVVNTGINKNTAVTLYAKCTNADYPQLNYLVYLNDGLISNTTETQNTNKSVATTFTNGENNIRVVCKSPFASVTSSKTFNAYFIQFRLWDEVAFSALNLANVTGARMYFDNEATIYNFKTANKNAVNITVLDNVKTRIELEYTGNLIIPRYFDVSLLSSNNIKVCANKQGVIHYEQLVISAVQQPVSLRNIFADCYIGADYTRFSYQDTYSLRAFTMDSNYELDIQDEGVFVTLAIIDGGLSEFHNIDILNFKQGSYSVSMVKDALSVSPTADEGVVQIYYLNPDDVNTATTLNVYNLNTNILVYTKSDFADLNEFTVYLNLSLVESNYTNQTVFKAEVISTRNGLSYTVERMFNPAGKSGIIPATLAFIIGLLILIGGLTLTSIDTTLGWFGIILDLLVASMMFLAVAEWYTVTLSVIALTLLLYKILLMGITQNRSVV